MQPHVQAKGLQDLGDYPGLGGAVVDREGLREAFEVLGLAAQNTQRHRMEGRDPGLPPTCRDERLDSAGHLRRGSPRERHAEDRGGGRPLPNEARDTRRDHARLARARSSQNERRAAASFDGEPLLWVQVQQSLRSDARAGRQAARDHRLELLRVGCEGADALGQLLRGHGVCVHHPAEGLLVEADLLHIGGL